MRRDVMSGVLVIIIVTIIAVSLWLIGPGVFTSIDGTIGGVIGGVVGGVLSSHVVRKYQDERFTQLIGYSSRNVALLVLMALPWVAAVLASGQMTMAHAVLMIFALWFGAIGIFYLSVLYYYKK
ncbi:MAG: hypothetical protein K9W43_03800 [Candidatus Thorarchaeota archaeon]|nr:hypothetical protein [Candidatus Thorarchaeota archaeon]